MDAVNLLIQVLQDLREREQGEEETKWVTIRPEVGLKKRQTADGGISRRRICGPPVVSASGPSLFALKNPTGPKKKNDKDARSLTAGFTSN